MPLSRTATRMRWAGVCAVIGMLPGTQETFWSHLRRGALTTRKHTGSPAVAGWTSQAQTVRKHHHLVWSLSCPFPVRISHAPLPSPATLPAEIRAACHFCCPRKQGTSDTQKSYENRTCGGQLTPEWDFRAGPGLPEGQLKNSPLHFSTTPTRMDWGLSRWWSSKRRSSLLWKLK